VGRPDPATVGLSACGAVTALGDAASTCQRLAAGEVALQKRAVPGVAGADALPLALATAWGETLPPRGWPELAALLASAPAEPWGEPGFPVIVSSSNFGVGNLLAYRRDGENPAHLPYGTPPSCVDQLGRQQGWGPDVTVVSHACVSAHLGLELGRRRVLGGARRVLVVSFDFLSAFVAGGFQSLKILNGLLPEPYRDRAEGSVGLGDGAAFAVLEATGPWRLSPAHLHNEMWHPTGNRPDGDGFARLQPWLARWAGGRRLWVKGHGTGTLDSGRLEAESAARLVPHGPLVSWKGSLGHTLGSCGLVELAIAIAGLRAGRLPGNVGSRPPYVGPTVQEQAFAADPFDATLLLANAFGGAHAACLLYHDAG